MFHTDHNLTLPHQRLADVKIIEGWMRGTYVVAGIFAISSDATTITGIKENIPDLYTATKTARRRCWPRGIAGTFLFPFYLSCHFPSETIDWVQKRRPYRWAVWHEPVLYDTTRNSVWMRSDYGQFGSAFYPLVFELYGRALTLIAQRLNRPCPDFINGLSTAGN